MEFNQANFYFFKGGYFWLQRSNCCRLLALANSEKEKFKQPFYELERFQSSIPIAIGSTISQMDNKNKEHVKRTQKTYNYES